MKKILPFPNEGVNQIWNISKALKIIAILVRSLIKKLSTWELRNLNHGWAFNEKEVIWVHLTHGSFESD